MPFSTRNKVVLLIGLVGGVMMCLVAGFYWWHFKTMSQLLIPHASEIDVMRAGISSSVIDNPAIPDFPVSRDDIPRLLSFFTNPKIDSQPMQVDPAGKIELSCYDGRQYNLIFYWTGKNPLSYSINGHRVIRGGPYNDTDDAYILEMAIRRIYTQSHIKP